MFKAKVPYKKECTTKLYYKQIYSNLTGVLNQKVRKGPTQKFKSKKKK